MPINKKQILKRTEVKRRGMLDTRKKEVMLAVMCRNPEVFEQTQTLTSDLDFRSMGDQYAVVYKVVRSFFTQYAEMPTLELLKAEVQQVILDHPGQMTGNEITAADGFIDLMFDPTAFKYDISKSPMYAKFALETFRHFKEEILAEQVTAKITREGTIIADLAPMLRRGAADVERAQQLGKKGTTKPFPDGWELRTIVKPVSSGVTVLDAFTGRGLKPGEIGLFMGPYGSCKTTIAIQSIHATAKKAMDRTMSPANVEGKIYKVVYISYEPDRVEFQDRCIAVGARIPRHRQKKFGTNLLDSLRQGGELHPYEIKHFKKQLDNNQQVQTEWERVQDTVTLLNDYVIFIDMRNADPDHEQGTGGAEEIAAVLNAEKRANPKLEYHLVWIDHAAGLVGNMMDSDDYTQEDVRPLLKQLPRQLRNWVAEVHQCPVWLLHQLSGGANERSPTAEFHHTDSDECKSIGMYVDFAIVTGPATEDGRSLAVFDCTKHRRERAYGRQVVKIDGQFNCVHHVSKKYVIDTGSRQIVLASEAGTIQAGGKKKKPKANPANNADEAFVV